MQREEHTSQSGLGSQGPGHTETQEVRISTIVVHLRSAIVREVIIGMQAYTRGPLVVNAAPRSFPILVISRPIHVTSRVASPERTNTDVGLDLLADALVVRNVTLVIVTARHDKVAGL